MLTYIASHGLETKVSDEEIVSTTLAIATGEIDEDALALWLESKTTG